VIEKGVYDLKNELFPLLGISIGQYKRRREDLMDWLKEFYDYDMLAGRPLKIHITEVYGEYQPLPRKVSSNELQQEKIKDYEDYVKSILTPEYQYMTKRKISREAIAEFGNIKYGHLNQDAVARRYVGPALNKYGEEDKAKYWVWYSSYLPLDDAELEHWRNILREEKISEQEASNAFYRYAQGQDISAELGYYRNAMDRIIAEKGDRPILSTRWREQ
jgi:hypothetical protein